MRKTILSKFDDFPIQQTSEPISYLATSDRNAYGRYWFNGYDPDGEFYFGVAFAVYPHREVMDCALSIVRKDGTQDSFRASRRMRGDRTDLRVGPMRLEISEPMRTVRVTIDKNSTGITADLTFHGTTPVHAEPLDHMRDHLRTVMQTTRYTQFGMWGGHITVGDRRQDVDASKVQGVRDRSWGFRQIGEQEQGIAPMIPEQVFWLWAPITWKDRCTHYGLFEYADGVRWKEFAQIFPRYGKDSGFDTLSDEGFVDIRPGEHRVTFEPGTRFLSGGEIDLIEKDGKKTTLKMETILRFHMTGIGYNHPTWGHGMYKGEEEITSEHWNVNEIDKLSVQFQHIQNVVRVTNGDEVGHGVLEQAIFGPHDRYPLKGWIDPVA
ncbi:MAG: hypothetical protein AB7E60_06325 [Sphingobium sp.]